MKRNIKLALMIVGGLVVLVWVLNKVKTEAKSKPSGAGLGKEVVTVTIADTDEMVGGTFSDTSKNWEMFE